MSDILAGTSAQAFVKGACDECLVETEKRCTMCEKHFCDNHLWAPANTLVADQIRNCKPCALRANELQFTEAVGKALSLLFSFGLKGVTLHSPNGVECYYGSPELSAGVASGEATAAVMRISDDEFALDGIFTKGMLEELIR